MKHHNDNDPLPFITLCAATRNVMEYLQKPKPNQGERDRQTAEHRDRDEKKQQHLEAVEQRLREIERFERRMNRKPGG